MDVRRRTTELTDPRALRALAHPVRMDLLGLLRLEGPMTATEAAQRLGQTPANCSFHLRTLARYGLVEEAGKARGRRRPWKATSFYTSWPDAADSPEQAQASGMLSRLVAERQLASLLRWLEAAPGESRTWQEAASFGDAQMFLTPEELAELGERLRAVALEYTHRTMAGGPHPETARLVTVLLTAFPQIDPLTDG